MPSELAMLMQQIEAEYTAAKNGLSGLAQGVSQHEFINARTERIAHLFEEASRIASENDVLEALKHVVLTNDQPRNVAAGGQQ